MVVTPVGLVEISEEKLPNRDGLAVEVVNEPGCAYEACHIRAPRDARWTSPPRTR